MSDTEIQFCEKCHNLLFIHLDDDDKLILSCKNCKHTLPYNGDNCIYTSTTESFDKSLLINQNRYITHDKTLPAIKSSQNIVCPNKECRDNKQDTKKNKFKYIKYDTESIKYMYICEDCGSKWTN